MNVLKRIHFLTNITELLDSLKICFDDNRAPGNVEEFGLLNGILEKYLEVKLNSMSVTEHVNPVNISVELSRKTGIVLDLTNEPGIADIVHEFLISMH